MSYRKEISHSVTDFDITCEEKDEYDKRYDSSLSYGYYSAYKQTGKLPPEWYERILELWGNIPKDYQRDSLEHQEYKKRFHKKLSLEQYLKDRDTGNLPNTKWYRFLIESEEWIPSDFKAAYTEYIEYCHIFNDKISFYDYYEKKHKDELPDEWIEFLDQIKQYIRELEQSMF